MSPKYMTTAGQGSIADLAAEATPPEILVQRVSFQRFAEAENRFDDTLAKMNGLSR